LSTHKIQVVDKILGGHKMSGMAPEQKRGRGRPATGQTPKRYFRMDDESWADIEAAAKAQGEDVSSYIRKVLLASAKRVLARR
jgi:hypothetical protein